MKVKGISWVGVLTYDYDRTRRFWGELLGLKRECVNDQEGVTFFRFPDRVKIATFRGPTLSVPTATCTRCTNTLNRGCSRVLTLRASDDTLSKSATKTNERRHAQMKSTTSRTEYVLSAPPRTMA